MGLPWQKVTKEAERVRREHLRLLRQQLPVAALKRMRGMSHVSTPQARAAHALALPLEVKR